MRAIQLQKVSFWKNLVNPDRGIFAGQIFGYVACLKKIIHS